MSEDKDIRWKQRFQNYEKAFFQLKKGVDSFDYLEDIGKEGLIQRFEYTLELAWKTLKDYLASKEVIAKFPKDVIKYAFQAELVDNGELWLQMLSDRNLMAHTYDESNFLNALDKIVSLYFFEMQKLYNVLKNEQ
ncbi:MAG: nucleotidyltransferase substrate binding protein [Bacteroidales bacterium]|nr:nucleotidyltransferase substrate binding protein [Bacteroidales bacterium]